MKKEYIRPELSVFSFEVEDKTNAEIFEEIPDITPSMNDDNVLGKLFG